MTKLFVNGCSITLGAELGEELKYFDEGHKEGYMAVDHDYRNTHRWSTLVAERFGMEAINIARGSGSNWRTWRSTVDFFDSRPDWSGNAIIQLTGFERFQLPLNEHFIDKINLSHEHYPQLTEDFNKWAIGGAYSVEHDHVNPLEEFSHWNKGSLDRIQPDWREPDHFAPQQNSMRHIYKDLHSDVMANKNFMSPLWTLMDCMRLTQTMIYYFRARNIKCLVWDAMSNIRSIVDMSQALRWVEQHETVSETVDDMYKDNNMKWIVILFNDPQKWIEMPRKTHERYFGMLREAGMYERFYNKWNSLKSMPELSKHDYSDMFVNPKHPKFIGSKPGGHPDEAAHKAIADLLIEEMTLTRMV